MYLAKKALRYLQSGWRSYSCESLNQLSPWSLLWFNSLASHRESGWLWGAFWSKCFFFQQIELFIWLLGQLSVLQQYLASQKSSSLHIDIWSHSIDCWNYCQWDPHILWYIRAWAWLQIPFINSGWSCHCDRQMPRKQWPDSFLPLLLLLTLYSQLVIQAVCNSWPMLISFTVQLQHCWICESVNAFKLEDSSSSRDCKGWTHDLWALQLEWVALAAMWSRHLQWAFRQWSVLLGHDYFPSLHHWVLGSRSLN